ncbi:MAG: hypothetical protein CO144_00955 [Candidatus Nealsonbacteria bacterium CG_4_9_14_3_um_filter_35_11]|uniref:Endoribonuclease YbeY n=2 Tax=Candidatus Nealsoniibacteriota TaxID=1817911 RepID=A0A2M7DAP6_9BACT|nr:MAG: hypothetical protein COV62_01695 [Candidatus Nealsonbacteria bacterium CG11_big_fil_rev_8_21_14_0_20_35_11]PIV45477.1 MAG: hypothetical protein COS24_02105 [Candidatus Nealsonbacteria bacterium CG02_land_8_20_14_3_00_34_20]PIZ89734.1 MAG: hypothetical protein COX88_02215 [Candidatus Nealsonbacteria bacterium CG_4_10_14_0_2_um_filter_35_20]PJA84664.1 MAG: hypothetical protein CO144_00955 [Candidatus Nealsonbacteria bacterium CG_4_9_14_3_um_filter_35_11]
MKAIVEINNLTRISINKAFLKKVAQKVLEGEGIKSEVELSIALIGEGRIRKLNKKYRQKNQATDVLAFQAQGLGEIVICPQQIRKNAKKFTPLEVAGLKTRQRGGKPLKGFNLSFQKELGRVLIHGILHLLRYDHEVSLERAKEMEVRQEYYLSKLFSNLT